jgi:hypothetical protein
LILPEKRNVLGGQNVIYGFNVHWDILLYSVVSLVKILWLQV